LHIHGNPERDGKRFIVRADEKLTAFSQTGTPGSHLHYNLSCQAREICGKKYRNRGLNPGESASPDSFFPSFRPAVAQLTNRENGKVCFMKTKTSLTRKSMSRSPVPLALLLIPLALAWFALAPQADATCREGCLTLNNTVLGDDALVNNVSGGNNTALGDSALSQNTFGVDNTATGSAALFSNISGGGNTANGDDALAFNTTGSNNTAVGSFALYLNTGSSNTAIGEEALNNNTTAIQNTAVGRSALDANTTGSSNTAVGFKALDGNTNASSNTAIGINALLNSTIGSSNIALGNGAGRRLTTGDNNIDIGNVGVGAESNTIRIGSETHTNTFIAGISGITVPGGIGVIVDSSGHLGTTTSSARF